MVIACVNIPQFAVETERQRQNLSTSHPILIGETTVFDCSLAADALGVQRGMRMSEAIALCDRAVVLAPDIRHYQHRLDEVLDLLEEFSPEVEAGALGVAYVSLKGLRLEPQMFAEELITSLHRKLGFLPSIGIAGGKFPAKVAACTSQPGAASVIPADQERTFLSPLPVSYLSASEAMRWRLHLLGLKTMGDIARLPLTTFQQQFGPEGKRCWELAIGIDNEPIRSRAKEEVLIQRLELPAPTTSLETILRGVERLLHAGYAKKDLKNRWVRKAVVRGTLERSGLWELPVPFREALANPRDAWITVRTAIARRPPGRPVEGLEVALAGLTFESGKQATMFEGNGHLWQQIEDAARQLNAQQGAAPLGKVVEVEPWSRIPERRMALVAYNL